MNYPKGITCGYKKKGRDVNKALNVADQDNSKPSSFVGKERERKVIKNVYRNKGSGEVTQLLPYKKATIFQRQTFIPQQRIYFERKKFNKCISTDIA